MTALFGSFANYGFVRDNVPTALLAALKEEVNTIDPTSTENRFNGNLAGNIESEFTLTKNKEALEKYILSLCAQYRNNWDMRHTGKPLAAEDLELQSYWVNFQKKHEFNPMHTHDGLYSFAIWLKVPYTMQQELEQPMSRAANMPRPGMFCFIYTNIFGEIREAEFPVDNSYEGVIFLFPSCLPHTVYPFSTSDEYRISISGNIRIK